MQQLATLAVIGILVYMIIRTVILAKRSKRISKMLKLIDQIPNEEQFFTEVNAYIASNRNDEITQKVAVVRLFADALYKNHDDFIEHLNALEPMKLVNAKKFRMAQIENEDSFFYLYLATPNTLYTNGETALAHLLQERLEPVRSYVEHGLFFPFHQAIVEYHQHLNDQGKSFATSLLEGNYAGYAYSKQLIGMYKQMAMTMLVRLDLDAQKTEALNLYKEELLPFEQTRLGKRWMKEYGILDILLQENAQIESTETPQADQQNEQ